MRIVGCFLEHGRRFLILRRHPRQAFGDTWGLPAGQVERDERDDEAMLRELEEETGFTASGSSLEHLGTFALGEDGRTSFVTYRVRLPHVPQVTLRDVEHVDYRWVTPEECDAMTDTIPTFRQLLRLVRYVT